MRRGKTRTLDLMHTIAPRADRWTAVTLLAMAAVLPGGMLFLYLFTTRPIDPWHRLEIAMASDSGARVQFVLLFVGVAVSSLAAGTMAISKNRVALRAAFAIAVVLALSYVVTGMWLLAFVAALPLWWAYKVTT